MTALAMMCSKPALLPLRTRTRPRTAPATLRGRNGRRMSSASPPRRRPALGRLRKRTAFRRLRWTSATSDRRQSRSALRQKKVAQSQTLRSGSRLAPTRGGCICTPRPTGRSRSGSAYPSAPCWRATTRSCCSRSSSKPSRAGWSPCKLAGLPRAPRDGGASSSRALHCPATSCSWLGGKGISPTQSVG